MTTRTGRGARRPGRPRSGEADQAILDAAFRLLRQQGYTAMSIEGVAAEAGVGKTTVYRRYDDKADLVSAALARHAPMPDLPTTGDLRRDLIELVSLFRHGVVGGLGMTIVGTLIVQEEAHPQLIALFRERVIEPRRRIMRAVLERGISEAKLRPDLDVETTIDMLVGAVMMRRMSAGAIPPDFSSTIVDTLWPALAAATG